MGDTHGISDEVLKGAVFNYRFFAEVFLKIKDKAGKLVPFVFNQAQAFLHEELQAQLFETGRVRALVLKGRQQGISTYVEGRFFWDAWRSRGLETFILTHEDKATEHLFEMVQRYQENLDERIRHPTARASAKELVFAERDVSYGVGTARTKGTGRSQTVHRLHWSEVSHSANQAEHAAGILQTVPDDDTEIILETTANGVGDFFHRQWNDPDSDYLKIFIPWFWQDEYRRPADGFIPTADEADLAEEHGLDLDQLAWRRQKITDLGSEDLFCQEYPCTATEAFLVSGAQFFPHEALQRLRQHVAEPVRGILEQVRGDVRFREQSNGWLEVWERPADDAHYVCGCDVAEGLPHGDLNSGHVLRRGDVPTQVARFAPQAGPDDMGRFAVLVCEWYGGSVPLGIERNALGIAAVIAARDLDYPHIFKMPMAEAVDNDPATHRLGWMTTINSRPVLCADLLAVVRDGGIRVHSEDTIRQMETFVRGPQGKPQASEGCQDDDVLGIGIAYQMVQRTVAPLDRGRQEVIRQRFTEKRAAQEASGF
jgi:hypothetical protein